MKINIYSVHDIKANSFGTPIFLINHALASRTLAAEVNSADSMISSNPEDFNLYCLGEYDNEKGSITTGERPELVCSAISLKKINEVKDNDSND